MASIYRKKGRNYDQEILSQQDYQAVQEAQQAWRDATDDAGRQAAHQQAEDIRARYGYSMGATGSNFSIINPRQGVSQDTQIQQMQNQGHNPTGQSNFYNQWNNLMEQYNNREPFTYDPSSDGLYQQYARQYQLLGRQAMEDTMGQAAGLTGGYGSSYSQSAGQQAYQQYLDRLNDALPELYGQAWSRYNQEGQNLLQGAQIAQNAYQQEVSDWWNQQNFLAQQAQNEQTQYWNQQNWDFSQQQYSDSQQQQARENLITAISNTGYTPTEAELAAAGMSQSEANYWRQYYQQQQVKAVSGGSSGGGRGRSGRGSGRGSGRSGGGSDSGNKNRIYEAVSALVSAHGTGSSAPWLDSGWLESTLRNQGYSTAEIRAITTYLHNNHGWRYMYEGR